MLFVAFKKAGRFAAVVVVPNCWPIQEGGRYAVLVGICGSQMSRRDPLICLQKGGRFAPVVVVICSLQKGGRFAAVVVVPNCRPIQEGGRFAALVVVPKCPKETHYFAFKKAVAPVVVVICCLQKGGRFAAVAVVPNYCPIQEGGSFAAVVVIPNCPKKDPSKRRLAAVVAVPNCPKDTHYFAFKKAVASRPWLFLVCPIIVTQFQVM